MMPSKKQSIKEQIKTIASVARKSKKMKENEKVERFLKISEKQRLLTKTDAEQIWRLYHGKTSARKLRMKSDFGMFLAEMYSDYESKNDDPTSYGDLSTDIGIGAGVGAGGGVVIIIIVALVAVDGPLPVGDAAGVLVGAIAVGAGVGMTVSSNDGGTTDYGGDEGGDEGDDGGNEGGNEGGDEGGGEEGGEP